MKIKPETLKQGAALMFGAVALAAYLTTVLWAFPFAAGPDRQRIRWRRGYGSSLLIG